MTPRSPNHYQHPKTTTISRRLRNRADQNLSVQPPGISQSRGVRPRRAATLPAPRHNPVDYQTPESHPSSLAWDSPDVFETKPPRTLSSPLTAEENRPNDQLLAQLVGSYEGARGLHSNFVPNPDHRTNRNYQVQPTPGLGFLPSPLPSVSGSHDFELRLSADPEQSHDPFLELQDMRYDN